jgi:hypothetical protein
MTFRVEAIAARVTDFHRQPLAGLPALLHPIIFVDRGIDLSHYIILAVRRCRREHLRCAHQHVISAEASWTHALVVVLQGRKLHVPQRSLDLRIEQFLRTRGVHVRLGDEAGAGIDIGRHLFALRGGERGPDALVTHAERVLHNKRGDRAVLQEFDELIIPVEADQIDRVPRLVRLALGHGFGRPLRHNQIRGEHAAQFGMRGDDLCHDLAGGCRLAIGDPLGDDTQGAIFRRDLLLEALGTLIERGDPGQSGDERHIAFGIGVCLWMRSRLRQQGLRRE